MRELEQFVSAQRRVFVDEVENENPVMYSEMLMARKLNQLFPMNHGGVIGGIDMAMRCVTQWLPVFWKRLLLAESTQKKDPRGELVSVNSPTFTQQMSV
jgi:hypothetical protein